MKHFEFAATRGGYGLRYFFNAGLNKQTGICDEEGTEFYDEENGEYIGQVNNITPSELVEMGEGEFQQVLEDNYIL